MPETNPLTSPASSPVAESPSDLRRLAEAVSALPADYAAELMPLLDSVVESTNRRRRILSLVQDALGQLRLDMKYLMFDLEATRRERDEVQQKLDDLVDPSDEFDTEG
ncbi:MAG: transcriptional regulator [Planctomycetota bacterium]